MLGVLVEKAHTVPDSYPLSLNALVLRLQPEDRARAGDQRDRGRGAGRGRCAEGAAPGVREQRLARHPLRAQRRPRARRCRRSRSRCWPRCCCAARRPAPNCAPTASGCTASPTSRRSKAFSTNWRSDRPRRAARWCVRLPRAPGAREARWAQLLCGEIDICGAAGRPPTATTSSPAGEIAALKAQQAALQRRTRRAATAGRRGCTASSASTD